MLYLMDVTYYNYIALVFFVLFALFRANFLPDHIEDAAA